VAPAQLSRYRLDNWRCTGAAGRDELAASPSAKSFDAAPEPLPVKRTAGPWLPRQGSWIDPSALRRRCRGHGRGACPVAVAGGGPLGLMPQRPTGASVSDIPAGNRGLRIRRGWMVSAAEFSVGAPAPAIRIHFTKHHALKKLQDDGRC
jgi:hypothetical protein